MGTKASIVKKAALNAASALTLAAFTVVGTTSLASAAEKVRVAVFSVNGASPTITTMIESATAAAKAKGWDVETFDGNGDQVATNNQANTYITRGFNALINIASDNNQMSGVIKKAKAAGIPFVSTFSGLVPGITADIGSNNVADGVIAASELVGRINGQGHVVKFNWNVLPALQERDRGFKAVMAGFPGIKVTEIEVKVPGQVDDTYNQLTNLMQSNNDIVAVWTGWDELAVAASRAIERAKKNIFVVSMDGNSAAYDLIRDGNTLALTVAYDVKGMGITSVDTVAAALGGAKFNNRMLVKKPCLIMDGTVPKTGSSPNFATCALFSADVK